jgi:hypothetical protein
MNAKITTDSIGYVTLSYDLYTDYLEDTVRVTRVFVCPPDGGYVREQINGEWKQVCDRLACMGSTLSCSSRERLAELIRREYRAMRRAEKRAMAEF